MTTVGEDMMLDVVNQADIPIGKIKRADVFSEHAGFRVSHVLIFNSRGEVLLQRLARTRKRNPGAWGSSVASYLFSSEDYIQAARRRASQELGINVSLSVAGKTTMVDDGCLKFITLFTGVSDGPFNFDSSQIAEVEFFQPCEIDQMSAGKDRSFTPTFLHVFRYFQSVAGRIR